MFCCFWAAVVRLCDLCPGDEARGVRDGTEQEQHKHQAAGKRLEIKRCKALYRMRYPSSGNNPRISVSLPLIPLSKKSLVFFFHGCLKLGKYFSRFSFPCKY